MTNFSQLISVYSYLESVKLRFASCLNKSFVKVTNKFSQNIKSILNLTN